MSKELRQFNQFPEWINYDPNDGKYVEEQSNDIQNEESDGGEE